MGRAWGGGSSAGAPERLLTRACSRPARPFRRLENLPPCRSRAGYGPCRSGRSLPALSAPVAHRPTPPAPRPSRRVAGQTMASAPRSRTGRLSLSRRRPRRRRLVLTRTRRAGPAASFLIEARRTRACVRARIGPSLWEPGLLSRRGLVARGTRAAPGDGPHPSMDLSRRRAPTSRRPVRPTRKRVTSLPQCLRPQQSPGPAAPRSARLYRRIVS